MKKLRLPLIVGLALTALLLLGLLTLALGRLWGHWTLHYGQLIFYWLLLSVPCLGLALLLPKDGEKERPAPLLQKETLLPCAPLILAALTVLLFSLYKLVSLSRMGGGAALEDFKALHSFKFAVYGLSAAVFLGLIAAKAFFRKPEKLFAVTAFCLGCLFLVVMTPLSPPDEHFHYHRSYELSNYFLGQWSSTRTGDAAYFDFSGFVPNKNSADAYLRLLAEFGGALVPSGKVQNLSAGSLNYFVMHIPQAIGVSIARLLGVNAVSAFALGRLCNLLFYIACAYVVIKNAKRHRLLFFLTALMPMVLHQSASLSYDTFINGVSLLLIGKIMNLAWERRPITRKDYLCVLILSFLLAPAKVIYFFLPLLFAVIPTECFRSKKQRRLELLGLVIVPVTILLVYELSWIVMNFRVEIGWTGERYYNLGDVLLNPIACAKVFARTLYRNAAEWLMTAVGYALSGLSLLLPRWVAYAYLVLLFFGTLDPIEEIDRPDCGRRRARRITALVMALVTFIIMIAMFFTWTPISSDVIQGIQGRYFIPLLPLLFLMLNNRVLYAREERLWDFVPLFAAAIDLFTVCYAVTATIS